MVFLDRRIALYDELLPLLIRNLPNFERPKKTMLGIDKCKGRIII